MFRAPQLPDVAFSPNRRYGLEIRPSGPPSLAELAQPVLSLAGLTIEPRTNSSIGGRTYHPISVIDVASGRQRPIALPDQVELDHLRWSRDGRYLSATHRTDRGLELWVIDLEQAQARRLSNPILNAAAGSPCDWLPGDGGLVCRTIPTDRGAPPPRPSVPLGPLISEHDGQRSPTRTYTHLLKSSHDEALFAYYFQSAIERISLKGERSPLLDPDLYYNVMPSPDGNYLIADIIQRPFSYQVPIDRFARRFVLHDLNRRSSTLLASLPLAEGLSPRFDAVRSGRRSFGWRSDRAATLYWVEALDSGDPEQPAPWRDALYTLEADQPDRPPVELWRSPDRFDQAWWGHNHLALISDSWYGRRRTRLWQMDPSQPQQPPQLRVDRNSQDHYRDPGSPLLTPGPFGELVLRLAKDGTSIYLAGDGASPQGIYPFLDRWNLTTGQTDRLWQAADPYYETVVDLLDDEQQFITQRQSQQEPPNFLLHDRRSPTAIRPLTQYRDPMPQFAHVRKEVIRYQRADGVPLSATLYLPPNYKPEHDGPLPIVFWVYPEDYGDRSTAGQVTTSANLFSRPQGDSELFLLGLGYGVLDNPSLPIVGENGAEPNDTYIEQLIAGATAAVDYVVGRGLGDRDRLMVGGHSYGAFTVANLLAHTNLFKAGIARSGAYNRTLTPFGFQGEQRSYWQARETYTRLSPFTFADRINEPLLLIHGQSDANPGTYPIQSERLYDALRGLGGTARLVMLPYEDHGYASREATGHVLWEMARWCDRYIGTALVQQLRQNLQARDRVNLSPTHRSRP
ncbi:MAG: S9 family peptidase [Oscillatoriales cyanobacterium]|nr:MAG: S9 family peptidase [Oscillatoriales cyanobacterium]